MSNEVQQSPTDLPQQNLITVVQIPRGLGQSPKKEAFDFGVLSVSVLLRIFDWIKRLFAVICANHS